MSFLVFLHGIHTNTALVRAIPTSQTKSQSLSVWKKSCRGTASTRCLSFLLSLSLYSIVSCFLSFNSFHVQPFQQGLRVSLSGSYTPTVLCRHILYSVIAALIVQEGKVFFKRSRSAAGPVADLILASLLLETCPHHVLHGDVIVVPMGHAFTTAVAQQHCLVTLVAEAKFTHSQLQLPQRAGLWPPGSFSPSALVVTQALAPSPLFVQQGLDHMLKLTLREALEHHGNWQTGHKSSVIVRWKENYLILCNFVDNIVTNQFHKQERWFAEIAYCSWHDNECWVHTKARQFIISDMMTATKWPYHYQHLRKREKLWANFVDWCLPVRWRETRVKWVYHLL